MAISGVSQASHATAPSHYGAQLASHSSQERLNQEKTRATAQVNAGHTTPERGGKLNITV